MKQGIRALNWTIIISMILVLIYLATALYSATQLFLFTQSFMFEEFQFEATEEALTFSTPITFNNTGYYDINQFQITTILVDDAGVVLDETSTAATDIPPGDRADLQHALAIDFIELVTEHQDLLFTDSVFNFTLLFNMRYAYALEFGVEMRDTPLPWGAPLAHLNVTLGSPSGNGTHLLLNGTLDVENHSLFDINGSLLFEIYNEDGGLVGRGRELVSLPSMSGIDRSFEVAASLENPGAFTGRGAIIVSLATPRIEQPIEVWREEYG